MSLHFFSPALLTFDTLLRWDSYRDNVHFRTAFNTVIKKLAAAINATDILIVPDLSGVDYFEEELDLTVQAYRAKASKHNMQVFEIDLY